MPACTRQCHGRAHKADLQGAMFKPKIPLMYALMLHTPMVWG